MEDIVLSPTDEEKIRESVQKIAIPITDRESLESLLNDTDVTKDRFNLVEILKVPIVEKLRGLVPAQQVVHDNTLVEKFVAVNKTFSCIPLVDARKTVFLALDSRMLKSPGVSAQRTAQYLKQECQRMRDEGLLEEEIQGIVKECERQVAENKEICQRAKQAYKSPETFSFEWNKTLPTPHMTVADKTSQRIYSISTQIPQNLKLEQQYMHFQSTLDIMMDALFFSQDEEGKTPAPVKLYMHSTVCYAYFISDNIKLNLFIAKQQ